MVIVHEFVPTSCSVFALEATLQISSKFVSLFAQFAAGHAASPGPEKKPRSDSAAGEFCKSPEASYKCFLQPQQHRAHHSPSSDSLELCVNICVSFRKNCGAHGSKC